MNREESKALVSSIQETMEMPRENGELVFNTPWESRIFSMAVLLSEKGMYPWKVFIGRFGQVIGETESKNPETEAVSLYYHHWIQALEKVLIDQNILTQEQLEQRSHEFASGQRHHVC